MRRLLLGEARDHRHARPAGRRPWRGACRPSARWPRGAARRTRRPPPGRLAPGPGSRTRSHSRGAAAIGPRARAGAHDLVDLEVGGHGDRRARPRGRGALRGRRGVNTATDPIPSRSKVLITRRAISPRLATSTRSDINGASRRGRPRSCGCPAAGRGARCTARAHAISAGRSMPVCTPLSCSIETTSSVATFPVAPGGTGHPPEFAEARLKGVALRLRARRTRWPAPGLACCGSGRSARRRAARALRPRRSSGPGGGWPCRSCRRSRSPAHPRRQAGPAISNTRSGST